MKKIMPLVIALVVSLCFVSTASAKVNDKLLDYAKSTHKIAGENVKLSNSDIVKVERYLTQNEVTDAEATQIIAKMDEIIAVLDKAGETDLTKLSDAQKDEVLALAKEAAAVVGATLSYDNSSKVLTVYQNGTKIEAISVNPYLKQTGSTNMIYVVAGIAVLGIAAVIVRKKLNA